MAHALRCPYLKFHYQPQTVMERTAVNFFFNLPWLEWKPSYQLYFVLLYYMLNLKQESPFGYLFIFVFLKISWSTWEMNTCLLYRECFTHISWKDFYRSTEFEFRFSFLFCQNILNLSVWLLNCFSFSSRAANLECLHFFL